MTDIKTTRKPASGPTTMQIWAENIRKADAITLHMANQIGRMLTRTDAMNTLIAREYAAIQDAKK